VEVVKNNFTYGVSAASYQIEGTHNKFETIWDTFAKKDGCVHNNEDGTFACDHYNLFKEDVQLIKDLGVDSYRLSISWARVFPEKGVLSRDGIDFYKSLLTELKRQNIKSNVTMYHWDMPSWVYDEVGGWIHLDATEYFLEYAKVIIDELDDLVDMWATINEPMCSAYLGHYLELHAPGHRDLEEYIKATHYILLAHGKVMKYYRENYKKQIGIVLNLSHVLTDADNDDNNMAVNIHDAVTNRAYLQPVFNGSYPEDLLNLLRKNNIDLSFIKDEDLKLISAPVDFLGINNYTHALVEYDQSNKLI